jgi:triosephosphate isomerase
MKRKKLIAGNWKMNKSFDEGLSLCSEIVNMVADEVHSQVEVALIPPFIHLHAVAQLVKGQKQIAVGAQNCHAAVSGAFTGEVSAEMIASAGATYVLVGHSERRQYFGEDATVLIDKMKAAFRAGLQPIYCVGESKTEREANQYFQVIENQLTDVLAQFSEAEMRQTVLAYEPVWAIGTGLTASPEQAQEVHQFIRQVIARLFNQQLADSLTIQYGGSVNAANAAELFAKPDIDGGLVGGASLKSRDFVEIVKAMA